MNFVYFLSRSRLTLRQATPASWATPFATPCSIQFTDSSTNLHFTRATASTTPGHQWTRTWRVTST